MATSIGFRQFARRMDIVADTVNNGAIETVRRAAIACDQAVVQATPVDTGRARANWNVSIGAPDFNTTESVDPGGGLAISRGVAKAQSYKSLRQGSIFIANSLPYIGKLEEGSSQQAPSGMVKFGLQAAAAQVNRTKLLGRLR